MTKQEQIEEMAVLGCARNPQAHTAEECAKCDFKQGMCNAYSHAEALYNAGYRKVLIDTENGKMVDYAQYAPWQLIEGYTDREVDKARKETAKELLNKFRGLLIDISFAYMFSKDTSVVGVALDECVGELNEMFKQYNVEVEE